MNIYKQIETEIKGIIRQLQAEGALPDGLALDKIEATPPREAAHGDIATNAAMVLAAQVNKKPREVADILVAGITSPSPLEGEGGVGGKPHALQSESLATPLPNPPPQGGRGYITKAEIAGPGFINLTLAPAVWQQAVAEIIAQGKAYGDSTLGAGKKINVEYVSANPTGPMHVGHARYIYGDALAALLEKGGYGVTREYYINDAGSQVEKLAQSAYLRYREACGENIGEMPEGLYPGDYLVPVGKLLAEKHRKTLLEMPVEEWLPLVRRATLDAMMELIKSDLAALGIHFDVFSSEQAIRDAGKVDAAVDVLRRKGLIYTGVLERPKGEAADDWEQKPQLLFRATEFGDDSDRALQKSDGNWTYFAPDIAYQLDKIHRGFDKLVMLLGIDHGGYVKRLKAAVAALSDKKVDLEIKLCQLVKFMRAGEPLKMSKRAGTFVTVREVVDEVGKDVFRFIMLTRKNDVPLDFDFTKVMEQSKDNPVFYVQYAHARARSVLRKAEDSGFRIQDSGKVVSRLQHPAELALIRLLCNWPRLVEQAVIAMEPHRVAFYLQEVAAEFHGLWNLGNDEPNLRFIIKEEVELTRARLMLLEAVTVVIASGLSVLGVEPVEEMR